LYSKILKELEQTLMVWRLWGTLLTGLFLFSACNRDNGDETLVSPSTLYGDTVSVTLMTTDVADTVPIGALEKMVRITIRLQNVSRRTLRLDSLYNTTVIRVIQDSTGFLIWQSPDGYTDSIQSQIFLSANDSICYRAVFRPVDRSGRPLPRGRYSIVGQILGFAAAERKYYW